MLPEGNFMNTETKICKNCHSSFIIEPDDFGFYEKIKISPPTWCPECRLQRKLTWRNERTLYKRICNVPGHSEELIGVYDKDSKATVYDIETWFGDTWDGLSSGRAFDFSKSFFEQFSQLLQVTPCPNLVNLSTVNCKYCNYNFQSKNCYLSFASDLNEDCAYTYHTIQSLQSFDLAGCKKMERCYESIDSEASFSSAYLAFSGECLNSRFLYNCKNCQDCFMCVNVWNRKYCILNEQYSKEEYEKKLAEYNLGSHVSNVKLQNEFLEFSKSFPRKYATIIHSEHVTGDYIKNSKNCINCFDIEGPVENSKHIVYSIPNVKDCYSSYGSGAGMEMGNEIFTSGDSSYFVLYSAYIWSSRNISYSFY